MEIDQKKFIDSLGGPEAASRMDSEARADALESHMMAQLNRRENGRSRVGPRRSPRNIPPSPKSRRKSKLENTAKAWASCTFRAPAKM